MEHQLGAATQGERIFLWLWWVFWYPGFSLLATLYSSQETLQGIQPSGADLQWYIEESSGVPVPRSHSSIQVKDFLAGRRSE